MNDNSSTNTAAATASAEVAATSTGSNGSTTNVIIPPPEIQTIIHKTASYVVKGGKALEDKIREKESSNPRFSFLLENDPYNLYYKQKLREIIEKGDISTPLPTSLPKASTQKSQIQVRDYNFIPPTVILSQQDLDIIKLAALFYARNGQTFYHALQAKEARNPQFEFLRPNHSFHQLFLKYYEQYTNIMVTNQIKFDRMGTLKTCFDRSDLERLRASSKKKEEEMKEKERIAFLSIDWHDFVVVQQIEFTAADEDDHVVLPPPTTIQALQSIPLEKRGFIK